MKCKEPRVYSHDSVVLLCVIFFETLGWAQRWTVFTCRAAKVCQMALTTSITTNNAVSPLLFLF